MATLGLLNVEPTMGATLVGVIAAAVLYGATCAQTFYYYDTYSRKDSWKLQTLVAAVFVFDTIHQVLISHTVINYNNPLSLNKLVWSVLLEVLFNGLIGLVVQSFLGLRLMKLSKCNRPLMIGAGILILSEFVCSVLFTAFSLQLSTWGELKQLKELSMAVNVLAAAGDVLIAFSLCYLLQHSRTGFRSSDTMITKLITFVVGTGFLTSVCAVASLVSITVWDNTLIYVAFYFCLGRLYSNSTLATLNARQSIRRVGDQPNEVELSFSRSSIYWGRHLTGHDSTSERFTEKDHPRAL